MNVLAEMISARLSSSLRTPGRLWPPRSWLEIGRLLKLYDSPEAESWDRPGVWCCQDPTTRTVGGRSAPSSHLRLGTIRFSGAVWS